MAPRSSPGPRWTPRRGLGRTGRERVRGGRGIEACARVAARALDRGCAHIPLGRRRSGGGVEAGAAVGLAVGFGVGPFSAVTVKVTHELDFGR